MRNSKTTLSGATAASCFAVAQVPGLPPWLVLSFNIGAAVGLALLGFHSNDCPPNCSGTDEHGNYRDTRRQRRLPFLLLPFFAVVVLALTSCAVPNPAAGTGDPPAPAYLPDPAIATWSNSVVPAVRLVAAPTGAGDLAGEIAAGVFAIVGALSVAYARHRSHVARTLADGVAAAGPAVSQAVLEATLPRSKATAVREEIVAATQRQTTAPEAAPPSR